MWAVEYELNPFIHSTNIFNAVSVPDTVPSTGGYGCGQNSQDDNDFGPHLLRRLCVTVEGCWFLILKLWLLDLPLQLLFDLE